MGSRAHRTTCSGKPLPDEGPITALLNGLCWIDGFATIMTPRKPSRWLLGVALALKPPCTSVGMSHRVKCGLTAGVLPASNRASAKALAVCSRGAVHLGKLKAWWVLRHDGQLSTDSQTALGDSTAWFSVRGSCALQETEPEHAIC